VTMPTNGQVPLVPFAGVAGEEIDLTMYGDYGFDFALLGPDGSFVLPASSQFSRILTLPASGTYQLEVIGRGTANLVLATTVVDGHALVVNDPSGLQLSANVIGALELVPFQAVAGDRVTIAVNGARSDYMKFCIVGPGQTPTRASCTQPAGDVLIPVDVTVSGTWNLVAFVQSVASPTNPILVWASTPSSDPSPLTANDLAGRVETVAVPGGTRTATFAGTAGQMIGLKRDGTYYGAVELHDPSGTVISTVVNGDFTLPATGTYTIVMHTGPYTNVATLRWYLSTPKVDPSPLAFEDPVGYTATLGVPHRALVIPVDVTANVLSTVAIESSATPAFSPTVYVVPAGATLTDATGDAAPGHFDFTPATSGRYLIVIHDAGANLGTMTVRLSHAQSLGAVTINGPEQSATFTMPWSQKEWTFTLAAPVAQLTLDRTEDVNTEPTLIGPYGTFQFYSFYYYDLPAGTYTLRLRSTATTTDTHHVTFRLTQP
jgi:hypothetical protein